MLQKHSAGAGSVGSRGNLTFGLISQFKNYGGVFSTIVNGFVVHTANFVVHTANSHIVLFRLLIHT